MKEYSLGKRKPIPLTEASTENIRFPIVDQLPEWKDRRGRKVADTIGVFPSRIEKLMLLGGINSLTVAAKNAGETTERIEVTHVTGSGEAAVGKKTTIDEKPVSWSGSSPVSSAPESLVTSARWVDATIYVNLEEATGKNNTTLRRDVRNPDAWAAIINKALKKGLRKEGTKNLIPSDPNANFTFVLDNFITPVSFMLIAELYPWAIGLYGIHFNNSGKIAAAGGYVLSQYLNLTGDILIARKKGIEDIHPSLIYGKQFDRAGVLYIASKTNKLAKGIK